MHVRWLPLRANRETVIESSRSARSPLSLKICRSVCACVLVVGVIAGCQRKPAEAPPAPPPIIPVSHPIDRSVTDYTDYTGRTDAVQSVNVRARVTGQLMSMGFEEGEEVQEGDLLFEVDPRPYQNLVDQAQSQLALSQAQYSLAKTVYGLDTPLGAASAVSQLQIVQDKGAVDQAEARVKVAEATLENAKLNLSFTEVRSPMDGRISRYYYTRGNLITQDQTLLTTIVSVDPMYAYFDVEERTYDRLVKATSGGKVRPPLRRTEVTGVLGLLGGAGWQANVLTRQKTNLPVFLALEGEEGYPHRGSLNFINNQVNPSTGTIAVRGIFPNSRVSSGLWALLPGMFIRVRLPLGESYPARLVIDQAIGSDQGLKFVYVVDAENKIQYRRVKTGALQEDGLRVIEEGLKPDDWVVVGGLPQLRPRMEIKPEQTPMPTMTGGADASTRRKPQPPAPGEEKQGAKGGGKKREG